jgi:hypothetical protein
MIAFKTLSALDQFHYLHPTLRLIVEDCLEHWPDPYMEVTRIADPLTSGVESGVHLTYPHRAIDIRTNDLTIPQGEMIRDIINGEWIYGDLGRDCAMQHGTGIERHLHLQAQNETRVK